jgi:hypothetical protein
MKQGQFMLRVYEMVEAFNRHRKPNDPLVVDDPGHTYCRVRTLPNLVNGSFIVYWWANIQTGNLLPCSKIDPNLPYEQPPGSAPWPYNLANEDPTIGFNALGVMQRGTITPMLDLTPRLVQSDSCGIQVSKYFSDLHAKIHQDLSAHTGTPLPASNKTLEKSVHDPCSNPDRVYTNYALEA